MPLLSTTLSTTATGGSARIETDGTTMSNLPRPSSLTARNASFSQASRTSPCPRWTKVVVEPRAPLIEHRHVAEQAGHDIRAPWPELPYFCAGIAPGGEIIPARAAAGLRVGRDDLDARADQVVPIVDLLRIALADQEDDRRIIRRAVVRQARLPVGRDQLRALAISSMS